MYTFKEYRYTFFVNLAISYLKYIFSSLVVYFYISLEFYLESDQIKIVFVLKDE